MRVFTVQRRLAGLSTALSLALGLIVFGGMPVLGQGPGVERGAMNQVAANAGESGTYQLVRSRAGAAATVQARRLTKGFAYTAWIAVFPDPSACLDDDGEAGCGPNDEQQGRGFLKNLGGAIAGGNGSLNFASGYTGFSGAMAEIHLVVRCHGPSIPGLIPEMISTPNGGCNAGQPNVGLCGTILLAILNP